MTNAERTVKDVVAGLRERGAEALAELSELYLALHETAGTAQLLARALREIAGETERLVQAPEPVSAERLRCLRDYARLVSLTADGHATAVREVELGINGWGLEGTAL